MLQQSERYYDAVYDTLKDYQHESEQLRELIQQYAHMPASNVLDVACGTGRHLSYLRNYYGIEGLDLNERMLDVARQRNPGVRFHHASMVDFQLPQRYDVILCLFSAIGYVQTRARLQQTLQTMHAHLHPGGILIIEPWITPEMWHPGYIGTIFVDQPDLKITRMDTGELRESLSVLHFHYLIGTPTGVEYLTEVHELGLFLI